MLHKIGTNLTLRREVGPATGWFGRAQRLVERDRRDCVEHGYLLLPGMFRHEAAGEWEAAFDVAAEAAACGSPPLVARHSGLAEIAQGLQEAYPEEHRALASFEPGDAADLAAKLDAILSLPHSEWARLSAAARSAAVERWSWETIAALILSPRG